MDALKFDTITPKEIPSALKKMMGDHGADTLIGSMMATEGVFILLFSERLNRDFAILVTSAELAPVLSKVYETLAGQP